jgi:hypothetical protein
MKTPMRRRTDAPINFPFLIAILCVIAFWAGVAALLLK